MRLFLEHRGLQAARIVLLLVAGATIAFGLWLVFSEKASFVLPIWILMAVVIAATVYGMSLGEGGGGKMNMARKHREETGTEWPEPPTGVTICRGCTFAEREDDSTPTGHCLNPDAPVSDWVYGFKFCAAINKGQCAFFRVRDEGEE